MNEYKLQAIKLPWSCTFGDKSHLNLVGKIVFAPVIVIMCTTLSVCELLFTKGES